MGVRHPENPQPQRVPSVPRNKRMQEAGACLVGANTVSPERDESTLWALREAQAAETPGPSVSKGQGHLCTWHLQEQVLNQESEVTPKPMEGPLPRKDPHKEGRA